MTQTSRRKYDHAELKRRAEAIYRRDIGPRFESSRMDEFVVIDVESGDFEIDPVEIEAVDRLYARHPDAQCWMRRVGAPYAHKLGGRRSRNEG
mgnify:CR=1 FL=1